MRFIGAIFGARSSVRIIAAAGLATAAGVVCLPAAHGASIGGGLGSPVEADPLDEPASGGAKLLVENGIEMRLAPVSTPGVLVKARGAFPADGSRGTLYARRYAGKDSARWRIVARSVVRAGRFEFAWRPLSTGAFKLKAVFSTGAGGTAKTSGASTLSASIDIVQPSKATWYGPGFYGNRTACGQILTRQMHGVAHRTLPCGTKVAISYAGKSIVVPVIDRGPYANGASWDLTGATSRAVGMLGTAMIAAKPQSR